MSDSLEKQFDESIAAWLRSAMRLRTVEKDVEGSKLALTIAEATKALKAHYARKGYFRD